MKLRVLKRRKRMEFNVLSVVQLVGGLALFIYSMTTMGKGLERAAGSKLEKRWKK